MAKARELNIDIIDEVQLFQMIESKSEEIRSNPRVSTSSSPPPPTKKLTPSSLIKPKALAKASSAASAPSSASTPAPRPLAAPAKSSKHVDLWVEEFRPKNADDLVAARRLYDRVIEFLTKRRQGQISDRERAVLLSGPPGIGKTTTALVACRAMGYDPIELNASDTRSQKLLNNWLKGFSSETLTQGAVGKALIFDEVDGMAGNEDRGGLQLLTQLIKTTKVPIICICNEITQKMKTLKQYCIDLRFQRFVVKTISISSL